MTKIALALMRSTITQPIMAVALLGNAVGASSQLRTYVSGTGNDSSPCTVSQPCKTFQIALAATAPGGEIYVLNSAEYGPLTINKAISITSEGAIAGVRATSSTAITISAGAADAINLRGLDIDGGNNASVGIQFNSGRSLNVQKSMIHNFTQTGINFAPSGTSALLVFDSSVTQNAKNGVLVSNSATATLSHVTAFANGVGILIAGSSVNATLTDVVASNNNYGIGASAAAVMIRNAMISNNAVGIAADQEAILSVGGSTVVGNGTGWQATNGGQIQSYSTNNVGGNATDGAATTTLSLQ
jgi:Right handed beta helix region